MSSQADSQWRWLKLKGGGRVKVDVEDYNRLCKKEWVLRESGNREKQVISMQWDAKREKIITTYLARQVMKNPPDTVVARREPTRQDFRKLNLVVCTRKEKERMRGKTKMESTSVYKGVCWDKVKSRWYASICVDGRRTYLGRYGTQNEAATAYNAAAKEHFGEFAYLNTLK